jgi:hypothetical protein
VLGALAEVSASSGQPAEEVDPHGGRLLGTQKRGPGDASLGGLLAEVAQLMPAAVELDEAALLRVPDGSKLGVQPAGVVGKVLVPHGEHPLLHEQAPHVLDGA